MQVQGQWVSQPYMGRNEDVSAYITTSDQHGPYASPTLPEILWTLKGKKTVIAATKKATKRKKSPGRAVKKAELG